MNSKVIYEPSQTTHWKNLFPEKMKLLGSQNLNENEELVATIEKVAVEKVKNSTGRDENMPVISFTNAPPMILNVTNSKSIATLYGESYKNWAGKSIQLYATKVRFGKDMVDGLRVRNIIPSANIDLEPHKQNLMKCLSLEELQEVFSRIPKYIKGKVIDEKNKMKAKLQGVENENN